VLQHHGGALRGLRHLLRRAHVPLGFVGVSAEHPEPALAAELQGVAHRLAVFWARDEGTLAELGLTAGERTFVAPDLSWLVAPSAAGPRPPRGAGVAVAVAGHGGLDADAWGPALAALPGPVRPWPFLLERDADHHALQRLLPDAVVPTSHDAALAAEVAVVVSARYHGLVFGLQQGRPVVGIGDAPKVRRLLHEQGLADWHVPADRPDRVGPVVASLLAEHEEASARAAEVAARARADVRAAAQRTLALLERDARPLDGRSPLRRVLRLDGA
jgi:polysaccharide pyruvyl transferase WcaK-like protein